MDDDIKGDDKSRLDDMKEQLRVLAEGHAQFQEEHRQLLKALKKRAESRLTLDERMALMKAAQQYADEKMAALRITVNEFMRRPPQHD